MDDITKQEIEQNQFMFIYEWVDSVNLSRPKKNIARDFSDGGKNIIFIFIFFNNFYLSLLN